MKKIISALALTMLSASTFAAGQDALYIGGSFGVSKIDTNVSADPGERLDDSDTAFKIFLGQRINSIFSIEGHYANLGKAEYSGPGFYASSKIQSFGVSGLAGFNITNNLRGFGKAGLHYWQDKVNARGNIIATEDSGIDPLIGGGLEYAVDKKLSIRGEYELFMGENDTNLLSVGLSYKF